MAQARASRVSFDDTNKDATRAFARVSVQEEGANARHSGRYTDILGSLDEENDWAALADLTMSERVQMLLTSTPFQVAMASGIMLNAAVIGGETDYPDLELWHPIETTFLIVFSTELLLRMFSSGLRGFFAPGEDQLWNLFDLAIVGLGIFDVVCEKLGAQPASHHHHHEHHDHEKTKEGGVSTLFRMIRLLRILRIFKIVRFLKQLYMLAFGFVEAIQAICWVTVLMFFVLYLCSIVMVRAYGRVAAGQPEEIATVLVEQFGSIKISMLSLFELMSNPGNLLLYHVLMADFPFLTIFLIAFVIFGSFGMIAMLTGIISESMFEKNQTRASEERAEREQKRETLKQKCVELFATVEKDEEDEAHPQDLEEVLPYVREMFEKLDLEYMEHDFDNIITLCDTDDSGSISESEFISGILSLCDGVRAASIQEVYYIISQMNAKVKRMELFQDEFSRITKKSIPELQIDMKSIMAKLDVAPEARLPELKSQASKDFNRLEAVAQSPPEPVSSTCSNGFDTLSSTTSVTETRLGEMKASLASTMDEHTQLLTKKIDALQANVTELCKRPDPLSSNLFNLLEKDIQLPSANKGRADIERLPELCTADFDKHALAVPGSGEPLVEAVPQATAGCCFSRSSNVAQSTQGRNVIPGDHSTPSVQAGGSRGITPLSPPPGSGTTQSLLP